MDVNMNIKLFFSFQGCFFILTIFFFNCSSYNFLSFTESKSLAAPSTLLWRWLFYEIMRTFKLIVINYSCCWGFGGFFGGGWGFGVGEGVFFLFKIKIFLINCLETVRGHLLGLVSGNKCMKHSWSDFQKIQ